jgi:hypothetical protein
MSILRMAEASPENSSSRATSHSRFKALSDRVVGTKSRIALAVLTGVEAKQPWPKSLIADPESIDPQSSSPLFGVIPAELRNEIFKDVLTGYIKPSDHWDKETHYTRPGYEGRVTIEVALISTCRLAYSETHQVVRYLNDYDKLTLWFYRPPPRRSIQIEYWIQSGFELSHLIPIERAKTITSMQLFMQQHTMEGEELKKMVGLVRRYLPNLHTLRITVRHGDWWFWENNEMLGMNPFRVGRVYYEDVCKELDKIRRVPQISRYHGRSRGWGNSFVGMGSLQKFELELETLISKKRQLDKIIELSKYWAFQMTRFRGKNVPQQYLVRDDEVSWYGWDGPTKLIVENCDHVQYRPEELEQSPHLRFTYQVALLTWRPDT